MLNIEMLNIDEIKPYKMNAKLHPKEQIEQIKESIKLFGFNDPIAIDGNNVIIEGNGRFKAVKELGYREIPCIKIEGLNEEQKKAYILVHNKLTMNTDFDLEMLNSELDNILNIDMQQFDFEDIKEEIEDDIRNKGEIEFTESLDEEHNYIVLYFDNDIDWLQAQSLFKIEPKRNLLTDKNCKGKISQIGVGRVINGAEAINNLMEANNENKH